MSAAWTPGPWHVEQRIFVKAENGWKVASVNVPSGRVGSWDINPQDNARLIAAAPALYDAAEVALAALRTLNDPTIEDRQAVEWLTAALAQARGDA